MAGTRRLGGRTTVTVVDAVAPVLVFGIMALIVGGVVYGVVRYLEHQKERMRTVAAAAGLQVDVHTKQPPALGFDLFDRGSSRKVRSQMWRAGEADSVFQYQYTEGSGDNSTTYRFTVALIHLPFRAPHLTIATENWWSRLKKAVGSRDIEVESPAFNERYLVRCADERFAIALLDPPMIAWMLSPYSGGGVVTFEFRDDWMLCHCKQLDLEDVPAMLTWSKSVVEQLPVVLSDLYGR